MRSRCSLVDQKRSDQEELSPILHAALIDSHVPELLADVAGIVCAAIAAVMTALKTGNVCSGRVRADRRIGTMRAFEMRKYERAHRTADPEQATPAGSRATQSAR